MSIYKSGWLTTPESKLARREDPDTSKAAAHKVAGKLGKMQQYVLELVEQAGERGTTIKEMQVLAHPEKRPSSISSRPNELEKKGVVFYAGDKRDGARVIRLIKYKHWQWFDDTPVGAEVIETMTLNLMKEHYVAIMYEDVGNGLKYKEANERMARLFIGKNQWEKHKETIWQWFDDTHGEIAE